MQIHIGAGMHPMTPPEEDDEVGVLAVEGNPGVANHLREKFQEQLYPSRFFVINAVVCNAPCAGSIANFYYYNANGGGSSISRPTRVARASEGWANRSKHDPGREVFGPGSSGTDFVAGISLETLLEGVGREVEVTVVKTEASGQDANVVRSARVETLRRVRVIKTHCYVGTYGERMYEGVRNGFAEQAEHLRAAGFRAKNEPGKHMLTGFTAEWLRS